MNSPCNIINSIIPLYADYKLILDKLNLEKIDSDPKYGLISFFSKYALERSGSTKEQKIASLKFLSKYFPAYKEYSEEKIKNYFKEFLPDKANENLNPIFNESIKKLNIPEIISLIRMNNYKAAYEKLIEQQGIGPKIANLYIRDISLKLDKNENTKVFSLEDSVYLFPIDVWVRDFIKALNLSSTNNYEIKRPKNMDKNYYIMSTNFCDFCLQNGLDIRKVNASIWIFGARYAGNPERMKTLINSGLNAINEEIQLIKSLQEESL